MKPTRIQRKRTKAWRMPPNTVYVGRGSKWGNPFRVGVNGDAAECVRKYARWLLPYSHRAERSGLDDFMIASANLDEIRLELAGKNVACWCREGEPCHGDLLLEWAKQMGR